MIRNRLLQCGDDYADPTRTGIGHPGVRCYPCMPRQTGGAAQLLHGPPFSDLTLSLISSFSVRCNGITREAVVSCLTFRGVRPSEGSPIGSTTFSTEKQVGLHLVLRMLLYLLTDDNCNADSISKVQTGAWRPQRV